MNNDMEKFRADLAKARRIRVKFAEFTDFIRTEIDGTIQTGDDQTARMSLEMFIARVTEADMWVSNLVRLMANTEAKMTIKAGKSTQESQPRKVNR